MSQPVVLVDASLYVFRAWHSMPDEWTDNHGHSVNAVHGFARFLCDLLERQKPQRIAVAFDESLDSSFRNTLYPAYKANREPAPESLKKQFSYCKSLCSALGLMVLADARYEADDLIGTALSTVRASGHAGLIISADKDLAQLLDGDDEQWDFARNERWSSSGVKKRYGVHAHQVADYLGLTGDAVDNIPGVPGIGPKTAATLLSHFDSLDNLLARIDEVPFLRLRGSAQHAQRLKEHRETALLCRQLATIVCDAPLPEDFADGARQAITESALDALCEQLRIGPMTRRRLYAAAQ